MICPNNFSHSKTHFSAVDIYIYIKMNCCFKVMRLTVMIRKPEISHNHQNNHSSTTFTAQGLYLIVFAGKRDPG